MKTRHALVIAALVVLTGCDQGEPENPEMDSPAAVTPPLEPSPPPEPEPPSSCDSDMELSEQNLELFYAHPTCRLTAEGVTFSELRYVPGATLHLTDVTITGELVADCSEHDRSEIVLNNVEAEGFAFRRSDIRAQSLRADTINAVHSSVQIEGVVGRRLHFQVATVTVSQAELDLLEVYPGGKLIADEPRLNTLVVVGAPERDWTPGQPARADVTGGTVQRLHVGGESEASLHGTSVEDALTIEGTLIIEEAHISAEDITMRQGGAVISRASDISHVEQFDGALRIIDDPDVVLRDVDPSSLE